MDINDFILNAPQILPELLSNFCVVNKKIISLQEIEKMGYNKFSCISKINMPPKLYKYFPNREEQKDGSTVNYSLEALKNNTVFMQSPNNFDDVYDSGVNLDWYEFYKQRLIEYCKRSGMQVNENETTEKIGNDFIKNLKQSFETYNNFENIFIQKPDSQIEELTNTLFKNNLIIGLNQNNDLSQVVFEIICKEYEKYINDLKNTFKVSCFTTDPFSQLMWSGYADYHRGFCVEYTVLPTHDDYKNIFYNLLPVIYCKVRPNITERFVRAKDNLTKEALSDIYFHGVLRKSIDWVYQDEWRLVLPFNERENPNVKFFPITKVYLGNRMPANRRKEIIDFCNSKNIQYGGIKSNPNIFKMEECSIKCEDCPNYFDNIK